MLRSVFLKGMRDLRRPFLLWALGVAVMPVLLGLVYPSIKTVATEVQSYVEALPEAFAAMFLGAARDFTSPVGYIDAELFSFMAPVVFIAFGLTLAAHQIAGEEEEGTLGLLLAYPVSRARVLAEKALVVVVGVALLTVAQLVATAAVVRLADMDLAFRTMAEGHVVLFLLTLALTAIGFAAGAATGRRGAALGVGAAVALGSYLLNALAPLTESLKPLRKASVFYYYGGAQPLRLGFDASHAAVLLAVAAAALLVAFLTFLRRDIRA